MSKELFETNFMLSLKNVFNTGKIRTLPGTDTRIKGVSGIVFRVENDTVPVLKSSKLPESTKKEIIDNAISVAKECINSVIHNGGVVWDSFHSKLNGESVWFSFSEQDEVLNMIGTLKSYDILKDNVKPMLEARILLDIISKYFGLKSGFISILVGETYFSEEDELTAVELLRRFGFTSSSYILDDLYTGENHEKNHEDTVKNIEDYRNKLLKISEINNTKERDFEENFTNILPDESIEELLNMSFDEVSDFVNKGLVQMDGELKNIEEMDKMFDSFKDVLTDTTTSFFNTFAETNISIDGSIDNTSVEITGDVGLPTLLK